MRTVPQTPILSVERFVNQAIDEIDWHAITEKGIPAPRPDRVQAIADLSPEHPYRFTANVGLNNSYVGRKFRTTIDITTCNVGFALLLGDSIVGRLRQKNPLGATAFSIAIQVTSRHREKRDIFIYSIDFDLAR
jgi:hypothetical protein